MIYGNLTVCEPEAMAHVWLIKLPMGTGLSMTLVQGDIYVQKIMFIYD